MSGSAHLIPFQEPFQKGTVLGIFRADNAYRTTSYHQRLKSNHTSNDIAAALAQEPVREAVTELVRGERTRIVSSYVTYHDIAVSQQTRRVRAIFEENAGLVEVYPVDYINEAIAAIPVQAPEAQTGSPVDSPEVEAPSVE